MKKIINICFVVLMLFLFVGCTTTHTHSYADGICTCGEKEKVTYTVVFKDIDGNILKTEEVEENKSATAPEVEDDFGYTFIGWDKEFSNVTSDLEVDALYDLMEFTVKFYGFYGELLKEEKGALAQATSSILVRERTSLFRRYYREKRGPLLANAANPKNSLCSFSGTPAARHQFALQIDSVPPPTRSAGMFVLSWRRRGRGPTSCGCYSLGWRTPFPIHG